MITINWKKYWIGKTGGNKRKKMSYKFFVGKIRNNNELIHLMCFIKQVLNSKIFSRICLYHRGLHLYCLTNSSSHLVIICHK